MTKVEFLQKLVKVFGQVSIKEMMSLIFNKYNELSEEEQKEFCSWLAGPNPKEKKMTKLICDFCNTESYRGLRAKINPIDDWVASEELKEMINEIHLMEDILDCNTCEYSNKCENCARAIEDR